MGHAANEKLGSGYCHGLGGNQVFAYTKRHQIMSDDNCLDASHAEGPINLIRCHGMGGNQEWTYDEDVIKSIFCVKYLQVIVNIPNFRPKLSNM